MSQDVWDLSDVAGTGTPSLKTMPEEDVRAPETAPTPEEEIPMQETAPEGYTEIRTAEELLAIRDSSDKYIFNELDFTLRCRAAGRLISRRLQRRTERKRTDDPRSLRSAVV